MKDLHIAQKNEVSIKDFFSKCDQIRHISVLQKQRDQPRYEAHKNQTEEVRQRYGSIRNQLRKEIKKTKTLFYKKALSSKRPLKNRKTI